MSLNNYFSLYTSKKQNLEAKESSSNSKPHSVIQWLAMLLGVLIQPFFSFYKAHGEVIWENAYQNWEFLLFAVLVAVIAFPGIYKTAFDSDKPKWIQIIPIFTAGIGWQTLVDTAISGAIKNGDQAFLELPRVVEQLIYLL